MPPLSEHVVFILLTQFAVLVAAARLMGGLAQKLRQPAVLGELLAGVLLGPAILGRLFPGIHGALFPADPTQEHLLEMLSWMGMILLILRTGLEVDLRLWRFLGRAAVLTSLLGIVIPYATGLALGHGLPDSLLAEGHGRAVLSMFVATAMSISAVKVIAKTLLELKLTRRDVGAVILAASITDDTIGWVLVSVASSIALSGAPSVATVLQPLGAIAAVLLGAATVGRLLVRQAFRWIERTRAIEHATTSAIVVLAFALAALTQKLGIHAVFGAFIAGVLVTSSPRVRQSTLEALDSVIFGVFAPIFFVYTGLKVTTLTLPPAGITLLILGVAVLGKVIGAGLGARLGGLGWVPALAVGIGMSSRGSMELVVARIGLDLGVLSPPLYAAIVLIPIVTNLTTPALLKMVVRRIRPAPAEAKRLDQEAQNERALIKREGPRIMVALSGGPRSLQAMRLAVPLAKLPGAALVAMSVVPEKNAPRPLQRRRPLTAESARALLDSFAEEHRLPDFHLRVVSGPSPAAAIGDELKQQKYDLLFVGAGRRRMVSNRLLSSALQEAGASTVLLSGEEFPREFRRLLVAADGSYASRGAAELALLYARAMGSSVSALNVIAPAPDAPAADRLEEVGTRVVSEVVRLGAQDGIEVDAQVRWSDSPGRAIVETARDLGADLLLLGALPQLLGRRSFLGSTVEQVLATAPCAVALFVPAVARAAAKAA